MNQTLKAWLSFGSVLCMIIACFVFVIKAYKYFRGFIKRKKLLSKIKKICQEREFDYTFHKNALFSVFGNWGYDALQITAHEKTYTVCFMAALKRRETYTLTNIGSYYTTSNAHPALLSHGHPASYLVMNKEESRKLRLPFVFRSSDRYVKSVHEDAVKKNVFSNNAIPILCVNPVPVRLEIVKTNRPEEAFDGDSFKGFALYSGHGLCRFLNELS